MADEPERDESGPADGADEAARVADSEAAVYDVPVEIAAVLGTARVQVGQLLKMGRGAVLELDRKAGAPIDIYVDKQRVARGDVTVLDDRLAVTLNQTVRFVR